MSVAQSERLADALVPAVEKAMHASGRRNIGPLADALAPVFWAALRQSFVDVSRRVVRALNRLLIYAVTPRGWRWRWESVRTRVPFRDVAARHSIVYPIKRLFLIHRGTGLLLDEVARDRETAPDGDTVSGMLTAIHAFVRDSFRGARRNAVDTIRIGDLTIWIEESPEAILAGIVDGRPPEELRMPFRETLSRIQAAFATELAAFAGSTSSFGACRPYLDACVRRNMVDARDRILPITKLVMLAPALLLAAGAIFFASGGLRWQRYVDTLQAQPGIVVLDVSRTLLGFRIAGLRDPLSVDPAMLLTRAGLAPSRVDARWETYYASTPEIVARRAYDVLKPPDGVRLHVEAGALRVSGAAAHDWIEAITPLAGRITGVSAVDTTGLVDRDEAMHRQWHRFVERLSSRPGIVILHEGREGAKFRISGLRDPLAVDPARLLTDAGFTVDEVQSLWAPYRATDPEIVLKRATQVLAPPPSVTLALQGGMLAARGTATHEWIAAARILARGMAGVDGLDSAALEDSDQSELGRLRRKIESRAFGFRLGQAEFWTSQRKELTELVGEVSTFRRVARRLGADVQVEIDGSVASAVDEATALAAGFSLAQRFLDAIKGLNADTSLFACRGVKHQAAGTPPYEARVTLRVLVLD